MEKVTVIIPTYNRPEILREAIERIKFNLVFDGSLTFLVGNDGDPLPESWFPHIEILEGSRNGLGANLNMLIDAADSELILQMDDDHYLAKPLDINQYVEDLAGQKVTNCLEGTIGWIRLFLGTEGDLNNDNPFYKFEARMCERYWLPNPNGPEFYIASNRPHLKHKNFHREYGWYEMGLTLGETEASFCGKYLNMKRFHLHENIDSPWVVIPVVAPSFDTWKHVGDSWQKQGL